MTKTFPISIFWFRRDLRLHDNHGLYQALQSNYPILPIFIFDDTILCELPKNDARVSFIHDCLTSLQEKLQQLSKGLQVFKGSPKTIWQHIIKEYNVQEVFTNRDYEPYAQQRDIEIYQLLKEHNIEFKGYKDHVIFEKIEILNGQNNPYTVFTPYSKKWRANLTKTSFQHYKSEALLNNCLTIKTTLPTLENIGFEQSEVKVLPYNLSEQLISNYAEDRDIPSKNGTSLLSPHLRFGTISVREVCRTTKDWSNTFMNEIIWRDFYSQVLYNFPHVVRCNFREKYNGIEWRNNEEEFDAWCKGKTGYSIVDAGMRQLNATGYMHNRVRMITASFLVKDLLIDWRWGEAYFAEKLLDFDLASNNGGWQWAAGTGTDAAPYFRIFNPESQQKKFDPDYKYVKKWVPEFGTSSYPKEIVNHKKAREETLRVYKKALNNN